MTARIQGNSIRIGQLTLTLQRTLRIPDDGKSYPLPPGLGAFPLKRVEDCPNAPKEWRAKGGVLVPMYAREAMWLSFRGPRWRPHAVKVGVGKVCAITGERWSESLSRKKQDYIVTPPQPWLDGIATGHGTIRQFVATQMGRGHTVEGQVTGREEVGGLQLKIFAGKASRFPEPPPPPRCRTRAGGGPPVPRAAPCAPAAPGAAMGLGAGGRMVQTIHRDPHGVDAYEVRGTRLFIHLVDALRWRELTGAEPPSTPISAATYAQHGLPWFELQDQHAPAVEPSATLQSVKSLGELDAEELGDHATVDAIDPPPVVKLPYPMPGAITDGEW
ncbi:MAG: hypothetical protein JJ863_00665 [Deltaproteobacteria bacterium]|nr:hypothetical protein [Deltaproteobacteria bacterium]